MSSLTTCGEPDRPRLIHDRAFDRLPYPPCRVGGESKPTLRIELFQGVDQSEIAFFDKIGEREPAIKVMLGDADDEPQVVLDHFLPRVEIASAICARVFELLRGSEERALPDFVEVDLGDVVEEVGADAGLGHVQRQLPRPCVRLGRSRQLVFGRRLSPHAGFVVARRLMWVVEGISPGRWACRGDEFRNEA